MNTSASTITTRLMIDNICNFAIPFVLMRFAVIPAFWYWVILGISTLIAIILSVLYKKKKLQNKRPLFMASVFAIATFFSLIISSNMQNKEAERQMVFSINSTFREKYEKAAENGSVKDMVRLGAYYSTYNMKHVLEAPKGAIRDDELLDHRDFEKAKRYLDMAAAEDSADAYVWLGVMKIEGRGCVPSRKLAIDLFAKAYELDSNNEWLHYFLPIYGITLEEIAGKND